MYALWEKLVVCYAVANCMAMLLDRITRHLRQLARVVTESKEMATRQLWWKRQLHELIQLAGHGDTIRPIRSFGRHGLRMRQNTV